MLLFQIKNDENLNMIIELYYRTGIFIFSMAQIFAMALIFVMVNNI